ncbi:MAG TPA: pilus assembly protein PilM [Candidatus Dormibacteraeota bacterium]|nr:pilus assembly protein PilM [Candidatus Dormibacteraeota bacterium]
MFGTARRVVGLDIGSSAVKALELKKAKDGYELLSLGVEFLPPDTVVEGAIRNPEELGGAIVRLFDEQKIGACDVATSFSGHSVIVKQWAAPPLLLVAAKKETVRQTLKQFLSPRGEILADTRSNMLIIRDIPSVLPTIDRLIHRLDRKSPQVEIEARVVEATRAFARDLGTQFGFAVAGSTGSTQNVIGGTPGVGTSPVIRDILLPPPLVSSGTAILIPGITGSAIPLNANLSASGPTSGITFAHTEPNLALDLVLSAAESKGIGRVLSQPKLITQDNEEATVKQGTKIPVQTVVNNTISVQFVDAVLELEVTPQITADGTVFMKVHVENTAIGQGIPRILGIPALDTQSEDTKVLVGDGGTVVIGGIILSQQQNNISQVPLFGSIPVIGHLFKHTSVSTQTQELLFFLTPRIMPG